MVRISPRVPKFKVPKKASKKLPKIRITAAQARNLMKDEQQAQAKYAALGLDVFANDERRHAKYFKKILINKSKQQQQIG